MSSDNYNILADPSMKEIFDSFIIETREIFDALDVDLIELESQPDNKELLNQIFRAFHTVKGTSGFLGLEKMMAITHKGEDILNKLRKDEAKLNDRIMNAVLAGFDAMKGLLRVIETKLNEDFDVSHAQELLENALTPEDEITSIPIDSIPNLNSEAALNETAEMQLPDLGD